MTSLIEIFEKQGVILSPDHSGKDLTPDSLNAFTRFFDKLKMATSKFFKDL